MPAEHSERTLRPAWALVGLVIGCVLAPSLVPDMRYEESNALVWAGIVSSASLLLGVIVAGVGNHAAVLRAENLVLAGLVYWIILDVTQGHEPMYGLTHEALAGVFAVTGLFAIGVVTGSVFTTLLLRRSRPPAGHSGAQLTANLVFWIGALAFVIGTLRFSIPCRLAPACVAKALLPFLPADGFGPPPDLSGFGTILYHLRYAAFLTPPAAVVLLRMKGFRSAPALLLAGLAVIEMANLFFSGGRRLFGTVAGATILAWILMQPRVRLRDLLALSGATVFILVALQAMLAWRRTDIGVAGALFAGAPIYGNDEFGIAVDSNFWATAQAMMLIPDFHPHTGWRGLEGSLFAFIPGSVYPSQPPLRGVDMVELIGMDVNEGFSLTLSTVGDLWIIGGYTAVIIGGLIYGFLANRFSLLLRSPLSVRARLMYAVAAMVLVVGLRGIHQLILSSFTLLALLGLLWARSWVVQRRLTSRPPQGPMSLLR